MSKALERVKKIIKSIDDIEFILDDANIKLTKAIENKIIKPAIRMHIVKIAEQFTKLKDDNAFKVLENFSDKDLRGISAVRNYIAHDYDSVDDHLIEDTIRYDLPCIKHISLKIVSE
jgi:uncharacterized protein with HEPN domain